MFTSILNAASSTLTVQNAIICTLTALALGFVIAFAYMFTQTCSKNFAITLVLLPAIVQVIITMVNGNLGTSIAVMGALTLVRFRSLPGKSSEIATIFLAMAVGIACGTGYLTFAAAMTLIIGLVFVVLSKTHFGERPTGERLLKITIPEDIDYTDVFGDIFEEYTKKAVRRSVRTTNLGSMFEISYVITLKDAKREKQMIDDIRSRNGNLTVCCTDDVALPESL